jgi:hypothetical protein
MDPWNMVHVAEGDLSDRGLACLIHEHGRDSLADVV